MTPPNRHLPGQCRHIIRRIAQRQFLLRPDRAGRVSNIVGYCYALAAQTHGIKLHSVVIMSNHVHLVLTDVHGTVSEFLRDAHSWISLAMNAYLGRRQSFWDNKKTKNIYLPDTETVVEKVLYTWGNPVEALLVERLEQWMGFTITEDHWEESMTFTRPEYFTDLPEEVTITPTPPPGFEGYDIETIRRLFKNLRAGRETKLLIKRRKRKKKVLGMEKCFEVSPFSTPKSPEETHTRIPRFAGTDTDLLARLYECMRAFWHDYRSAWNDLNAGLIATFPAGTVKYRRLAEALKRGDPHIPNYQPFVI